MADIVLGSALCGVVAAAVESIPGIPAGLDNALVPAAVAYVAGVTFV